MENSERLSYIKKARDFALAKHGNQRYGDKPYSFHLFEVYAYASVKFYLPVQIQEAAWLHDVLEDTDCTYEELEDNFGPSIAWLVYLVTDQPGKNRRERHLATYPLIREDAFAVALKLCDRIANVAHTIDTDNYSLWKMYSKEYAEFRKALYLPNEWEDMWACLDEMMK